MRNKVFNYLAILCGIVALAITSCSKKDDPDPVKEPKCTVLVYMVADNDLGGGSGYGGVNADKVNLNQMQQAVARGALNGGRLLVYYDPSEVDIEPQLLEITEGGTVSLKAYSEQGSSLDADFMRQVLTDAAELAPAPKNWLVLWSHGTGWIESLDSRSAGYEASTTAFGKDTHPYTTEMNVGTLASVLGSDKYYDVIYFDCCFMGCIEVMYELRNAAKEIVSSATELPVNGMPYDVNVPAMFADDATARQVAENTLNHYLSLYNQYGPNPAYSCTMTVVNTDGIEPLAEATRAIQRTGVTAPFSYDNLNDPNHTAVPLYRRTGANSRTFDFGHYINHLEVDDQSLLDNWNEKYRAAVTYFGNTPISYGLDMSEFTGLGSYIVHNKSDLHICGYTNLAWYKDVVSVNPSLQDTQN